MVFGQASSVFSLGALVAVLCLFVFGLWPLSVFVCFVLLCFSGPRGKICTSSLRFCVVVWFMPPVVFVQFQQRFERVSVPALYVLRFVFRTEPLSLIGRTQRRKKIVWLSLAFPICL